MIHTMKLREEYFNYIKLGTKKYEIRLNDEKRQKIKIGDLIEFQKSPLLEEKFIIKVEDILYFNDFSELFNEIKIEYLADKKVNKEVLELELNKFYSKEEQEKLGVVVFKLKKDNIIIIVNLSNISKNEEIYKSFRKNYINFDNWYLKRQANNDYAYITEKNNEISSIMILKLNETDSEEFFEKGNILKIRTLVVNDKNKGIGSLYLQLVDKIAKANNIKYVYLTIKESNNELIKFIEKKSYIKYSNINDEVVYYKII